MKLIHKNLLKIILLVLLSSFLDFMLDILPAQAIPKDELVFLPLNGKAKDLQMAD